MTSGHLPYRGFVLLLMALLAGGGCASSAQNAGAEKRTPASAGPPDVLLADAMRLQNQQHNTARALPLVKMAAEKAPDRADIAWLYSQLCAQEKGCQPEPTEARLRRLAPGNAAACQLTIFSSTKDQMAARRPCASRESATCGKLSVKI